MKEVSYEGPGVEEAPSWKASKERSRGSASVSPIRTYRMDADQLLKEKKLSKVAMIMAEQKKRRGENVTETTEAHEASHLGMIIFVLVLVIVFACGVGFYVLFRVPEGMDAKVGTSTSTGGKVAPRSTEPALRIDITRSPREQVLADLRIAFQGETSSGGGVRAVAFIKKSDDEEVVAPGKEVLLLLSGGVAPGALIASLPGNLRYEITGSAQKSGVIILATDSYGSALSAMLGWEYTLKKDLALALHPDMERKDVFRDDGGTWKDERIAGIDTRMYRDSSGRAILGYAFIDKRTLVVFGSDIALDTLLRRIRSETKG